MRFCCIVFLALFASVAWGSGGGQMGIVGYQLDVSRSKVPKMETLYRMIDILARLGYNQFQLYTEHTFAYSKHETVWRGASPITPSEARQIDDYCADRGIEFVPNQNSFGHLENWLRHPEYNDLAEAPQGGTTCQLPDRFYELVQPMCLCPTDPRSIDLIAGLYDELFPCFRSKFVNVGCDETMELLDEHEPRMGRSVKEIAAKGPVRVYLDYMLKIHALCTERGHRMMFWGDIILHHPELISELPKDVICLNWGYEHDHPFEKETAAFEKAGRDFIVCPSTSSWGSIFGRTANMMGNIDNALSAAERHGAIGAILPDWGDGGYPNPWIVSVPGIVYFANRVKGKSMSREQLAAEIDSVLGCRCGQALLAYGDVYEKCGGRKGFLTEMFFLLRQGRAYKRDKGVSDEGLAAAQEQMRYAQGLFDPAGAPEWVRDDFALLELLSRAVALRISEPGKKNFRAMFEPEYRRLWLKSNRPGGLERSLNEIFRR